MAHPRRRAGWRQKVWGLQPHQVEPVGGQEAAGHPNGAAARSVWLHGVSVGEIQLLAPLIARWCATDAAIVPWLSTTTSSGMEVAEKLLPEVRRFYFPFDFSWAVGRTLDTIRPAMVVLGELELWPNLIAAAARRSIPVAVVNGRMSERSYRGFCRLRPLVRQMFSRLALVGVQNDVYAERFRALGCPPEAVVVTGNTKLDNVNFDRHDEQVVRLQTMAGIDRSRHHVLIAGSTHGPEERVIATAFGNLRPSNPDLRLIIVPRHPDRFDAVWNDLQAVAGLRMVRRSQMLEPLNGDDWDILLVDTVGELRWWWGLADTAIVGGSFGNRGGQNMLEPAAYGANVLFGPHTWNFKDVTQLLLDAEAARIIPDLPSVASVLAEELAHRQVGRQRGQRARQVIAAHQGALQRTVELLHRRLRIGS
ncbi:MAG: 3-deoxy-D-manno-octulosonic acid transferase [Pirellulaceae bacterium]|nr:MAG: 3-deoxy-D-manno-octulosonic acid transferase [Pirellulaceae bacterium]